MAVQITTCPSGCSPSEKVEQVSKVFELPQTLKEKWLTEEYDQQQIILEFVRLNCMLNNATLCRPTRKPVGILAEKPFDQKSGGSWTLSWMFSGYSRKNLEHIFNELSTGFEQGRAAEEVKILLDSSAADCLNQPHCEPAFGTILVRHGLDNELGVTLSRAGEPCRQLEDKFPLRRLP